MFTVLDRCEILYTLPSVYLGLGAIIGQKCIQASSRMLASQILFCLVLVLLNLTPQDIHRETVWQTETAMKKI